MKQLNQLKENTGSERTKLSPRKTVAEKDEDGIVFGQLEDAIDGQRATIGQSVLKNCGARRGCIAETASKLADKT